MRRFRTLSREIYLPVFLVLLSIFILLTFWAGERHRSICTDQTAESLMHVSRWIAVAISPHLFPPAPDNIRKYMEIAASASRLSSAVLLSDGTQIDDDSGCGVPELSGLATAAFSGSASSGKTYNWRLNADVLSVAVPVTRARNVVAVVFVCASLKPVKKSVFRLRLIVGLSGFLCLILTGAAMYRSAGRFTDGLDALRYAAGQFEMGNLDYRLVSPRISALAQVVRQMNRMAGCVDQHLKTAVAERNELEIVLHSMVEGVIAVDAEDRITNINHSAARMFYRSESQIRGRTMQEVVRNPELHQFVKKALRLKEPVESEVTFYYEQELIMKVQSTPLPDASGAPGGVLLVFHDITRMRSLERMRSDFAANVSHEIRTPLTAIKGFVETLQNGAVEKPDEAERFLGIIERHANRLSCIVDDLMKLSEIEMKEQRGLTLTPTHICTVLKNAADVCRSLADARSTSLDMICDPDLTADIDAPLLEQAVVNLIDNAIKYSPAERTVHISGKRQNGGVILRIRDEGPGIPNEHLNRLWERFYRVDRSRSRKQGGTGLGLAIVKHIVKAHGGIVHVTSKIDEGSIFEIHLPRNPIRPRNQKQQAKHL